jgi:C-terminal processing protease CtpA/Prc
MRRVGIAISVALVSATLAVPASYAQDSSSSNESAQQAQEREQERAQREQERAQREQERAQMERAQMEADTQIQLAQAQRHLADEQTQDRDVEAKLAEARKRLEEAARQVAELSAQLGADATSAAVQVAQGFRRGVIGLQLDPASGPEGARVQEVSPGGPAAEAGVRPGDVIVAVNGTPISGKDAARKVIERMRRVLPDTKVKLSIRRDGKAEELQVTTRSAYAFAFGFQGGPGPVVVAPEAPVAPMAPMAPMEFPDLSGLRSLQILSDETGGMELASLTPELGWYFGTSKGVLVLRAPENDAFGLKDGDVVLSIDGREPQSGTHATRILRSYQPGEPIDLKIMRQRRAMDLKVTLPRATTAGRRRLPRSPTGPQDL